MTRQYFCNCNVLQAVFMQWCCDLTALRADANERLRNCDRDEHSTIERRKTHRPNWRRTTSYAGETNWPSYLYCFIDLHARADKDMVITRTTFIIRRFFVYFWSHLSIQFHWLLNLWERTNAFDTQCTLPLSVMSCFYLTYFLAQ